MTFCHGYWLEGCFCQPLEFHYKETDMKDFYKDNPKYLEYIGSLEWQRRADTRKKLDNGVCQVCGRPATEVHHLTYRNFRNEKMEDLVSLCKTCHRKAEDIYDPAVTPWAMDEVKPEGNNFMAAMRVDAANVAEIVWEYIRSARGRDFDSMMSLRQPVDKECRKYWKSLEVAVMALCRKRYSLNTVEDRTDIVLFAVLNRVNSICLSFIEHQIRNEVQSELHDSVTTEYMVLEKWKDVAEYLGISNGMLQKFRKDEGTSFGPSLREAVLYYCALDASAGIRPLEGFGCLSDEDYTHLNGLADYMVSVSGTGAFKGEYKGGNNHA